MATPISDATATFGARVRARRHELGLSQEAAADLCGVHWTFLGQVERGQRNISLHNILKLAEGLTIDPGELVTGLHSPEHLIQSGSVRPSRKPERWRAAGGVDDHPAS